jgi:hypothetical protein
VGGTYYWGKHDPKTQALREVEEWLALAVEPLVEHSVHEAALRKRAIGEPKRWPDRPTSPPRLLAGLVRCAKCGSSYTLETSGKGGTNGRPRYRYYNCRTTCRIGKAACIGGRIPVSELDGALLEYLATVVCTGERCQTVLGVVQDGVGRERARRRHAQLEADLAFVHERIALWERESEVSPVHATLGQERLQRMRVEEAQLRTAVAQVLVPVEAESEPPARGSIDGETLRQQWVKLICGGGDASLSYLHNLVERIELDGRQVRVVPRGSFLTALSRAASESASPPAGR